MRRLVSCSVASLILCAYTNTRPLFAQEEADKRADKKYGWVEIKTGKIVTTPTLPKNSHLDNPSDPYHATGPHGKRYAFIPIPTITANSDQGKQLEQNYGWVSVKTGKRVTVPIVPENSHLDNASNPNHATGPHGKRYAFVPFPEVNGNQEGQPKALFGWVNAKNGKLATVPVVPENSHLDNPSDPIHATSDDGRRRYAYAELTTNGNQKGQSEKVFGWIDVDTGKLAPVPIVPEDSHLDKPTDPYYATDSNGRRFAYVALPMTITGTSIGQGNQPSKTHLSRKRIVIMVGVCCLIATAIAVPVAVGVATHHSSNNNSFTQQLTAFNYYDRRHSNDYAALRYIINNNPSFTKSFNRNPVAWLTAYFTRGASFVH